MRHETPADLQREANAAQRIEFAWNCTVEKLIDTLYVVDWAVFRNDGSLRALAEYKHRSSTHKTHMVGLAKWARGRRLAQDANVQFVLFVEWPHGLHYFVVPHDCQPLSIERDGSSRGAPGDIEPMVHLDPAWFKPVPGVKP